MTRGRMTGAAIGSLIATVALAGCSATTAEPVPASVSGSSAVASAPASATASSSPAASTPASASAAASTPASAAASPAAPEVLRVKVISQLKDPVDPSACASADATAGSPAGAPVTVSDSSGTVLGTQPLRVPEQGEPYGPGGHTFEGWGDLEEVDGAKVTYACFYLAEFPGIAPAETYVISIDGATDVETTPAQLAESEGWILQLIG